jgi:hypothetical protein
LEIYCGKAGFFYAFVKEPFLTVIRGRARGSPGNQLYVLHLSNGHLLDSDHHDAYLEELVLYFSPDNELIKKDGT